MFNFDFVLGDGHCGCGTEEPDEDEIERILREIEEDDTPAEPTVLPIPAPNWPTRKGVEVEVE